MTRVSSQSSTRLATAEATHVAPFRTSLLTRRRSPEGFDVRADVVAIQIEVLQNAVRAQGQRDDRAPSTPMSV
jgi:hypothetical protein